MSKLSIVLILSLFLLPCAAQAEVAPSAPAQRGLLLNIDGAIGPATSDYVERAIGSAADKGYALVILRMDTPGGLDTSMRKIIQAILASPVPVVGYVSPSGARAASAGTYILYACHVAAMAPATNLGAATPVAIGGVGMPAGGAGSEADAHTRKAVNDAEAYIRSLAQLRGRNADWAARAVREAASLEANKALKAGVVDIVASNLGDLLKQLNGRKVNVLGRELTLDTQGLVLTQHSPDWRSRLLSAITDPNVAYILMLLGVYGLIFEFTSPGAVLPGVAGAICLLLALYAFQVLPINYAGLALILFGIALMVGEAYAPGFGVLGIGGVVAFVIGSLILIETDVPGYGISRPLIGAFALVSAALFFFVIHMAVKARRRAVVSGREQLIGMPAVALTDFEGDGRVRAHGELWQARSHAPLHKGQQLRITAVDGLTLEVVPQEQTEPTKED